MKYADKIGAKFSIVLGDNEIAENKAMLKNMKSGEQLDIKLDETFVETFSDIAVSCMFEDVIDEI